MGFWEFLLGAAIAMNVLDSHDSDRSPGAFDDDDDDERDRTDDDDDDDGDWKY